MVIPLGGAICRPTRDVLHQFLPQASCLEELSKQTDEKSRFLCSAVCLLPSLLRDMQRSSTYFSSNIHRDLTSKNAIDNCYRL